MPAILSSFISSIGLCFDIVGAVVLLAPDWVKANEYLIKIGRKDPGFRSVPLLGYPLKQARKMFGVDRFRGAVVVEAKSGLPPRVTTRQTGFHAGKEAILALSSNELLSKGDGSVVQVQDDGFDELRFNTVSSSFVGKRTPPRFVLYKDGSEAGYINLDAFKKAIQEQMDGYTAKAGVSLLVAGFSLQIIGQIASILPLTL